VGVQILCMFAFHQYDGLLSYFSTPDLKRLILACGSAVVATGLIRWQVTRELTPPGGVIITQFLISVGVLSAMRTTFRRVRVLAFAHDTRPPGIRKRVGIVGAGDCGAALAKELLAKPNLLLQPVAFFDDFRGSACSIHGIPLVGKPERMAEFRDKLRIDEIIIAMPSAPIRRIKELLKLVHQAGLDCRTVPSMDQLATGHVSVSNLRPVDIRDLLGRPTVEIQGEAVRSEIEGRTVLVTGAGGSIGSELCRQILSYQPAELILVERSEPQLFLIEQELRDSHPGMTVVPVVGDITHRGRMREVFKRVRPDVVFHAAAHKHVPMMELQPGEAIRNNVFGTALMAELAVEAGVDRFVLISTDKAVNPTNVMGATKRLAELYVQSLSTRKVRTKFMAVRFGNVLGSSGSVVPTFTRQIATGGPVTVTHPDVTRFFMTIPEAVALVLQASTLGKGGDIFVLDMGKPVRILDLALQMIALSGLTPHEDIEIAFTGLRPGEKLYEELAHGGETVAPTEHPKITRLVGPPLHFSFLASYLHELTMSLEEDDLEPAELKQVLAGMLPEYSPCLQETEVGQLLEGAELSTLDELYAGSEPAPLRLAGPYRTT
jgi:FlaA1/EpsC-like NDP-sugar epimerase